MSSTTTPHAAANAIAAFATSPPIPPIPTNDPIPSPDRVGVEQRGAPRVRLRGEAVAVFSDAAEALGKLTHVELLDACCGGFGVHSPVRVHPGSTFTFTPDAGRFGRQSGLVVRCEEGEDGFRLGLATGRRAHVMKL